MKNSTKIVVFGGLVAVSVGAYYFIFIANKDENKLGKERKRVVGKKIDLKKPILTI